jgi:hypothetical protein
MVLGVVSFMVVASAVASGVAAASTGAASTPSAAGWFDFEEPVLMGEGDPRAGVPEHFWFPEDGAVVSHGGDDDVDEPGAAVVANMRFTMDGTPSPPGLPHTTTTVVSWDSGRTYSHLWFDHPLPGTASRFSNNSALSVGGALDVPGVSCTRALNNRSFTCAREAFFACVNSTSHNATVCSNTTPGAVRYVGWPFPVARFTYCSKIVSLAPGQGRAHAPQMVQLRAYSHHMNEVGGPDENLAAFGSSDGGSTWEFLAVVAARDPVWSAKKWEGPGENDLTVLSDGRLLAVFRVDSCKPCVGPQLRL